VALTKPFERGSPERAAKLFSLFGLRVRSDIPLPELSRGAEGEPDVIIKRGSLPPIEGERVNSIAVTAEGAILNIPRVGRYLIREGREIVVEADPAGSERHLRLFLLGSAFGGILHQRHLLPLHANSIEFGGRAVAFMGHSGAGKSTMAAWFHDRGFNVLADDVCVVTFEGGAPMAQPGIPRLRMWRDALEASGRSAEAHELSFDDADKYNVPTRQGGAAGPVALGAIYLLMKGEGEPASDFIQRLSGIEAIDALVANTYRGGYVPMMGTTQKHLESCLALARSVPVFTVRRTWGKDHLEREFGAIREHVASLLAP
jgi:hypothetical protein